jgi:hypothetical protein
MYMYIDIYIYIFTYIYVYRYKYLHIYILIPKERAKLRILVGTILDCSTHFIVTGRVAADDDVAKAKDYFGKLNKKGLRGQRLGL